MYKRQTLPALNGAAWLHAGPGVDAARLRAMLRAVQTSSPSFVTLLALDDARAWMEAHGAQALARLKAAAARFHAQAASCLLYTSEEYDRWRYHYPEFDTSGQWVKVVPSQKLSDELVQAYMEEQEKKNK